MLYKHFPNSCWPFPADPQVWLVSFERTKDFFSPSAVTELILGDSSKYIDFPNVLLSHWVSHHILSSVVVGVSVNKISQRGCLRSFTPFSSITFYSVSTLTDQAVPLLTEPLYPSILSLSSSFDPVYLSVSASTHMSPFPHEIWLVPGTVWVCTVIGYINAFVVR